MNKNVVKIIFHENGSATLCVNGIEFVDTFDDMRECAEWAMDARNNGVKGWESAVGLGEWEIMQDDVTYDLTDFFYGFQHTAHFNVNMFAREIDNILSGAEGKIREKFENYG